MSAGTYCTYELKQCVGGWIVTGQFYNDAPHVFLKLADALAHLEQQARANFCCPHDEAGNPLETP